MSADTTAGHDAGGGNKKVWWWGLAILAGTGLGIMLFFMFTGQPFADWSTYFEYGMVHTSNGLVGARPGVMMLWQWVLVLSAGIWLISRAMTNPYPQKIKELQAKLDAEEAKGKKAAPAAAAH